jgi:glucose-6-phosphate 1-dehydrogenase
MVVFGATGDLAKRKLIPSLFHLHQQKLLPERFAVVGNSRKEMDSEGFRRYLSEEAKEFMGDEASHPEWADFLRLFSYVTGDANEPETFDRLHQEIQRLDAMIQADGRCLFYLATAPRFFLPVVEQAARAGLNREEGGAWRRFIFEKPFGHDLASARQLNCDLAKLLQESQIYRIDHYLGKETVQNIMVMRFANGIFEPIWNRNFIQSVDILVAETLGVEDRGAYYDQSGALRDMVPNHLFQILSFIAMEPPSSFDSDAVRTEKTKALKSIRPMTEAEILRATTRGQYGPGKIDGRQVAGYRDEKNVSAHSFTETYASLRLWLDNWRWAGVPFRLRTGKRLTRRLSEVRIQFRCPPLQLFRNTEANELECNQLVLQIQPDERVSLHFGAKVPGAGVKVGCVEMDMNYAETFGKVASTGYETLIFDCMNGDGTLFQRADQVEAAWGVVDPILKAWAAHPAQDFPNYRAGSWGPDLAASAAEASAPVTARLGAL